MGQGLVAAARPPCRRPWVSGAWGGFKRRGDDKGWGLGFVAGKTQSTRLELDYI
jgi:hypothetical protein